MSFKKAGITCFLLGISLLGFSQVEKTNKGNFYLYWGWNRCWFNASAIHFEGEHYKFTLKNVKANDRQNPIGLSPYLNLSRLTIPQYNVRLGYFINEHYHLSIGTDHMKYVVQTQQTVPISGYIQHSETLYDGIYTASDSIVLQAGFLELEHTDGLNYPNIAFQRMDQVLQAGNMSVHLTEGLGVGLLIPKTNATLLNNVRYDKFHLSGYGLSSSIGVQVRFGQHFFIQSEWKGGFIHMPHIRTTDSRIDTASQQFFFSQWNIVFGANLYRKSK